MRQNTSSNTVQIQEPTLKEIRKHHSYLRGSCLTGTGCITLFFIALYATFKLIVGNGPTVLTTYPTDFPRDIPQTNTDRLIKVVEVDATTKTRALWVATAIPRFILSPVLSEIDPQAHIEEEKDSLGRVTFLRTLTRDDYIRYLGLPTGANNTKTVVATWNNIKTYPSIAVDAYEKQLTRSGFTIAPLVGIGQENAGITFTKGSISGTLRAIDLHPDQPGIEFMELVVNYQ